MAKLKKVARSFADRLRESPYGGYDPKKDPYVKRHPARQPVTYNSDKNITQDILRNVGTTGRNLAALTLGLPGDIQDISALKDAPRQLPNSEQLAKTFGGDPNHPSWLPASLIAPGPGEAKAGMNLLAKIGGNIDPTWAMTLFHGTPHKFDKFALDKIGTGEGAQAFGHGLYFAENPGVANSYKETLAGMNRSYLVDGKKIGQDIDGDAFFERVRASDPEAKAIKHMAEWGDDDAKRLINDWRDSDVDQKWVDEFEEAFEKHKGRVTQDVDTKGHLYEIELPDEITERMLDWDAPLSEQPENVKKALEGLRGKSKVIDAAMDNEVTTGGGFYKTLTADLGDPGAGTMTSPLLREAGIPGIRFYDGSSRGKQARLPFQEGLPEGWRYFDDNGRIGIKDNKGLIHTDGFATEADAHKHLFGEKGTRNIVVFDPEDITQVKRDGQEVYKKGLADVARQDMTPVDRLRGNVPEGVELDIFDKSNMYGEPVFEVSTIEVASPGQGVGTDVMRGVIQRADDMGATLTLNADSSVSGRKGSKAADKRLIEFYKRHGFVENKGRNKDFRFGGPTQKNVMYRLPEGK